MLSELERKQTMYLEYLADINESDLNYDSLESKSSIVKYYDKNPDFTWIDLFSDDNMNPIGFIVIGQRSACHPNCDYYIADAFVNYKYRNRGIMTSLIKQLLKNNPKISMSISKGSSYGKSYFINLMIHSGYISMHLPKQEDTFYKDENEYFVYAWEYKPEVCISGSKFDPKGDVSCA